MQLNRRTFLTNILIISGLAGLHFYIKNSLTNNPSNKKKPGTARPKIAVLPSTLNPGFYFNKEKLYYVSSKKKLSGSMSINPSKFRDFEKKLKPLKDEDILSSKKFDQQITEWMAEDYACHHWNQGNKTHTVQILTKVLNHLKKQKPKDRDPRILYLAAGFFSRYYSQKNSFSEIEQFHSLWNEIISDQTAWKTSVDSWQKTERGIRWQKTASDTKKITWHKYTID